MPQHIPTNAEGFIVAQAHTAHLPYGRRGSDYSGCGWIAVYNFLAAMGKSPSADAIRNRLSRGWFKGRLGTGPLRLRRFVQGRGVPLQTARTQSGAAALAQNAKAGILLYAHPRGLHYVAFTDYNEATKKFLNVGDGQPVVVATLTEFLQANAKTPFCYLMVPL